MSSDLWNSQRKIELFCNQIKRNQDGSYLVEWGYHNHGSRSLTYASRDCQLIVYKGGVIMIPQSVPNTFLPGLHYSCFTTVLTEETILAWQVKKTFLNFNIKQFLENLPSQK